MLALMYHLYKCSKLVKKLAEYDHSSCCGDLVCLIWISGCQPEAFSSQLSISSPAVHFLTPLPASSWVLVAGNERQAESLNGSAMLHHNRAHNHHATPHTISALWRRYL